jgi:hypothetical protein
VGETKETSVKNVTDIYNKIIVMIKNNSVQLPEDELINSYLGKIEEKGTVAVERFLRRRNKENEDFKKKMKQQINLNMV